MRRFVYFATVVFAAASTCSADPGIGGIEFFGYGGLDVAAIRKALPVKGDGARPSEIRASMRKTVNTTSKKIQFRDEPRQSPRLPEKFLLLHEKLVFSVLMDSSDARHRAVASRTAGYAEYTPEQIRVLYQAARDPDRDVRNNAIRALGVLAASGIKLAAPIPESLFIELLSSGIWADRNKAIAILAGLTRSRNPRVLAAIKERPLDALIECARWRWIGHSYWPRVILGRIAGIEEKTVVKNAADPAFVDIALSKLRDRRAAGQLPP